MELSQYLDSVREQLSQTTALADEHNQQVAQQLSASLEAAMRLALFQALSDASAEISAELAPGSVELRIQNNNPTFAVNIPQGDVTSESDDTEDDAIEDGPDADGEQARISLRLPQSLKKRVDDAAADEQVSANQWITRAVSRQLRHGDQRERMRRRGGRGRRGWRGGPPFPPFPQDPGFAGPFGPPGSRESFGPHGGRGGDDAYGPFGRGAWNDPTDGDGRSGRVQGWVR